MKRNRVFPSSEILNISSLEKKNQKYLLNTLEFLESMKIISITCITNSYRNIPLNQSYMKISHKKHSNPLNNCISNPSIRKPQHESNKVSGILEQASDTQVPTHRLEYRIQHALHRHRSRNKAREFNDKKAYKPHG